MLIVHAQTVFLSGHLQEYLPGLSSVLSFAAISVRPAVYALFEDHVLGLQRDDLRPALKSLILGLLPAVEEETSEDFERAYNILRHLEQGSDDGALTRVSDYADGYFWQCLFLGVITSPSKRQGALNYAVRRLPSFRHPKPVDSADSAGNNLDELADHARMAISPEPGLLIRFFASGLSDSNILVQRGFLDLLTQRLPLDSPVLQTEVNEADIDCLISAVIQILLRKDMSLNKRIWSWFLRSDSHDRANGAAVDSQDSLSQRGFFESYGSKSLERTIKVALESTERVDGSQLAITFRICTSLMDRWEIGGTIIRAVFPSAMARAFTCSLQGSVSETTEMLKSANLFFDGVEAHLIWAEIIGMMKTAFNNSEYSTGSLDQVAWIIDKFNLRDEEMVMVHIPLAVLSLVTLVSSAGPSHPAANKAMSLATRLADLIPPGALESSHDARQSVGDNLTESDVGSSITRYYDMSERSPNKAQPVFAEHLAMFLLEGLSTIAEASLGAGLESTFSDAVSSLVVFLTKAPAIKVHELERLLEALGTHATATGEQRKPASYPILRASVDLLKTANSTGRVPLATIASLEPALTSNLWQCLSPMAPRYHVEASHTLWQIDELLQSTGGITASCLTILSKALAASDRDGAEAVYRFGYFWDHTLSASKVATRPSTHSSRRKSSAVPSAVDAARLLGQVDVLIGPLLIIVDILHDPRSMVTEAVRSWLLATPSLPRIVTILADALKPPLAVLEPEADASTQRRKHKGLVRDTECTLTRLIDLLKESSSWTWQCFGEITEGVDRTEDAFTSVVKRCLELLCSAENSTPSLDASILALISVLIDSPLSSRLIAFDLDTLLVERLLSRVSGSSFTLQIPLLHLIPQAINLRIRQSLAVREHGSRASLSGHRPLASGVLQSPAPKGTPPTFPQATPNLVRCLRLGFTSQCTRLQLGEWLAFLSRVLPTFTDAFFAESLPLVESICAGLEQVLREIQQLSHDGGACAVLAPEPTAHHLLEALEMVLAMVHQTTNGDDTPETIPEVGSRAGSFFSNVTSSVFKPDGLPGRNTPANSRLITVLSLQDAVRTTFKMWKWASASTRPFDSVLPNIATTAYHSLRLRNKARQLLEQIFSVEPLESLEVLVLSWRDSLPPSDESVSAELRLLHVMPVSKPKTVVVALLDAICSRTPGTAFPVTRQSSQTADIGVVDAMAFFLAYLDSMEDDAIDEIWSESISFLKDVLSNPMPYRQVLPALLSAALILAEKLANTNFGEQKRMRRELGDIFQKLLTATLTTSASGHTADEDQQSITIGQRGVAQGVALWAVIHRVILNLDSIVESPERATVAINSICTTLISPKIHAKDFPNSLTTDILLVLADAARKTPSSKIWRRDVGDALNNPKILTTDMNIMESGWFPLLYQLLVVDRERLPELLAKLSPPSSAGLMFGVGANAARLDADRKTQANLRKICLLLLAAPENTSIAHLRETVEKLTDLFGATHASSPSSAIKAELFMVCRALFLSTGAAQIAPIWPLVNDALRAALTSLIPMGGGSSHAFTNLALLQACKLLDQLVATSPDDFQLHEWLYITNTVDAVYQPPDYVSLALADHVAAALSADIADDKADSALCTALGTGDVGKRRQLLDRSLAIDTEDVKAQSPEDFARAIVKPFLGQLSIHAYEGVYSMDRPDLAACRRNLLADLLDSSTMVE